MSAKPQSRYDNSITSDQNVSKVVSSPHRDIKRPTPGDRLNAKPEESVVELISCAPIKAFRR